VHAALDAMYRLDRASVDSCTAKMRRAISSVAFAVSTASDLTSEATTANPLPASPARTASMVAFSASKLVCPAMLRLGLTTSRVPRSYKAISFAPA